MWVQFKNPTEKKRGETDTDRSLHIKCATLVRKLKKQRYNDNLETLKKILRNVS